MNTNKNAALRMITHATQTTARNQVELGVGIGLILLFAACTALCVYFAWLFYQRKQTDATSFTSNDLPDKRGVKMRRFWRTHRANFFACLALVLLLLTIGGMIYVITGKDVSANT